MEIARQTRNHCGSPAGGRLSFVQNPADISVQTDQFGVDCQSGPRLRLSNPVLDRSEQADIVKSLNRLFLAHPQAPPQTGIGRRRDSVLSV